MCNVRADVQGLQIYPQSVVSLIDYRMMCMYICQTFTGSNRNFFAHVIEIQQAVSTEITPPCAVSISQFTAWIISNLSTRQKTHPGSRTLELCQVSDALLEMQKRMPAHPSTSVSLSPLVHTAHTLDLHGAAADRSSSDSRPTSQDAPRVWSDHYRWLTQLAREQGVGKKEGGMMNEQTDSRDRQRKKSPKTPNKRKTKP